MLCVVRLMFDVGNQMSDRDRTTSMCRPNFAFSDRSHVRAGGFRILLQLPQQGVPLATTPCTMYDRSCFGRL
jgi:hypothetical protein